jgi:hypothetical protein
VYEREMGILELQFMASYLKISYTFKQSIIGVFISCVITLVINLLINQNAIKYL